MTRRPLPALALVLALLVGTATACSDGSSSDGGSGGSGDLRPYLLRLRAASRRCLTLPALP